MKKSVLAVVGILLFAGIVGGVVLWQYVQKDPVDVAEGFLEQIEVQDFTGLEVYFDAEPPELERGFRQFGQAFGLSRVTLKRPKA